MSSSGGGTPSIIADFPTNSYPSFYAESLRSYARVGSNLNGREPRSFSREGSVKFPQKQDCVARLNNSARQAMSLPDSPISKHLAMTWEQVLPLFPQWRVCAIRSLSFVLQIGDPEPGITEFGDTGVCVFEDSHKCFVLTDCFFGPPRSLIGYAEVIIDLRSYLKEREIQIICRQFFEFSYCFLTFIAVKVYPPQEEADARLVADNFTLGTAQKCRLRCGCISFHPLDAAAGDPIRTHDR